MHLVMCAQKKSMQISFPKNLFSKLQYLLNKIGIRRTLLGVATFKVASTFDTNNQLSSSNTFYV